ncbi:MAG: ArsA family ATPase [Bdellovibrionales bacterium]|nr:ArsA family ATPase [Bdellovibrionales bacterium]
MAPLLKQFKILVCAGTGGVGKTTISASLGLWAAQEGLKVLVLTIDPARRLADALGLKAQGEAIQVTLEGVQGELWADMIHPEKVFDEFIRMSAPTPAAAERLLRNPLYQQLASNLSGSQEFTSLEKVLSSQESNLYDLIVLDTPPTQHALDFLRAPQKIFNLFQESVTKWFIEDKADKNIFKKVFHRGTQMALSALKKVTGGKFIEELSDFFDSVSALQDRLRSRSIQIHRMLSSSETGFLLVTGSDEAKMKEAKEFFQTLEQEGHRLSAVVINRVWPNWTLDGDGLSLSESQQEKLQKLYKEIQGFTSERLRIYDNLVQDMGQSVQMLKIPELNRNLHGITALRELARRLELECKGSQNI